MRERERERETSCAYLGRSKRPQDVALVAVLNTIEAVSFFGCRSLAPWNHLQVVHSLPLARDYDANAELGVGRSGVGFARWYERE